MSATSKREFRMFRFIGIVALLSLGAWCLWSLPSLHDSPLPGAERPATLHTAPTTPTATSQTPNVYCDGRPNDSADKVDARAWRRDYQDGAQATNLVAAEGTMVSDTQARLWCGSLASTQIHWYVAFAVSADSGEATKLELTKAHQKRKGLTVDFDRTSGTIEIRFDTTRYLGVAVYGGFTSPIYRAGPPVPQQPLQGA